MFIDLPWYGRLVFKAGRPVVLVAALVMSIPGEIHLAMSAGWSKDYARLMPVCVSVYAACAAVIADVAKRKELPGRKSALAGAGAALVLALLAQDISHLISLNYMGVSAVLVALVSAIPPCVAAHMLHMAAAPANLASHVETEDEIEEDGQLSLIDVETGEKRPRRVGKRGRKGVAPDAVVAAAEKLRESGEKVNGATLGAALGLSRRSGTRYVNLLPMDLRTG